MGNTFEIHSWQCDSLLGWRDRLVWSGEDKNEAFTELERLKATGEHPCLKFIWRG